MNLNRLDKLAVGLVILLGAFLIDYLTQIGSAAYILVALYLLRFSGDRKNAIIIAITASIAIVCGFYLSRAPIDLIPTTIVNLGLSLSILWICVYANYRFREFITTGKISHQEVEVLTAQKNHVAQQLQSLQSDLENQMNERKQVDQELLKRKKLQDAMAHHFPDGVICVLNTEMKFILADGGEMEELGLNRNSKKNESTSFNLKSVPDLKKAFAGESLSTEIVVNNKSYSLNAVPIPDANNVINEVLVVLRNITDQKKLENYLIKALEKEKELNVLKSQFVTMASHKFRTPLSTILSSVFLLENYTDADYELEKTAFFDKIKRSVHNLTSLLNDYLSLGKLEEGKLKVTYTETDVKAFFNEFLQEIGSIKKVKQKIHYSYEGNECTIMTDKFLLKNILTNLLSNAIEYSPHDAEIQLSAELKKDMLKIKVTDQGIGIPDNEQHQIFKRFYRGQNANNVEGTGLGLNIAKKYIRLLKGTIEFTSQLNKGTTFTAIIPVINVNILEKQA